MATWDILHIKSLEVEHGVPDDQVRQGLAEGRLTRDDCVRKPGEDRWWRVYERTEFRQAAAEVPAIEEEPPQLEEGSLRKLLSEAEPPQPGSPPRKRPIAPQLPLPLPPPQPAMASHALSMGETPIGAVIEEPEEGLPYQKNRRNVQEELDMTPMVDVAMQLILFFMVTSSMIMQSCLEFPKPAPEEGRPNVAPTIQTIEKLKLDSIIVHVKADNTIWIDEDKQPTKESDLLEKLKTVKRDRGVAGGIVVSADDAAYHEKVVAVIDAANVAELKPIKMAASKKSGKRAPTKKRTIKT